MFESIFQSTSRSACCGVEQFARLTDISKGARLRLFTFIARLHQRREIVGLSILTPWGEFRAQCKVVRQITGPEDLGVEFRLISDDAKDILERWLKPS